MRIRDILFIASLVLGAFAISVVSGLYIKQAVSHEKQKCFEEPVLKSRPGKPNIWINKTRCEKMAHKHTYQGSRYGQAPYAQPRPKHYYNRKYYRPLTNDELEDLREEREERAEDRRERRNELRLHVPFVDLHIPIR